MMNWKKGSGIIGLLLALNSHAQWEVGAGWGNTMPLTGYKQVLKNGWLLSAEAKHRLGTGHFSVGGEVHYTRLQKDRKPYDDFQNARMTIAPLLVTAEYENNPNGLLRPFVSLGLGVSVFSFSYYAGASNENFITNASFTIAPQAGIKYVLNKDIVPFVKTSFVLLTDGPPQGFPRAEKLTGYNALVIGLNYTIK